MSTLIFRGPLFDQITLSDSVDFTTDVWSIPVADVLEEAAQMPTEEESTVSNLRGESEQASVRLTFVLPVFERSNSDLEEIDNWIASRTRVYVRLRESSGNVLQLGITRGLRVRKLDALNAQFGQIGATSYLFETTYSQSGAEYAFNPPDPD